MRESSFIVFAVAFPVSPVIAISAGLVLAIFIAVVALWLVRGGKKNKAKASAASGTSDWQRQVQQGGVGTPGAWNQSGMGSSPTGGWGQQAQQPANPWGAAQQPAQQQSANPWGAAQQQSANPWGAAQQQPANPWGAAQQPAQQQPSNPWGAPVSSNLPQQPAWGMQASAQQQPPPNAWGTGQQPSSNPWEAQGQGQGMAQPPAASDPWGQQQAAQAQPWNNLSGNPLSQSQQGQSAPTAYSGSNAPSWGQPAADPWAAPAAQPYQGLGGGTPATPNSGAAAMPSWSPGGFAAQPSGMQDPFGSAEGDKTMLRSAGLQMGLGLIRVEEGKEPGRVYEVRKESLSIGRSRESDIFLEDLAVSRLHASVLNAGNGNFALRDEGSANGTKVNGQLMGKSQTYPLQEGDRIQLGQTVLVFTKR